LLAAIRGYKSVKAEKLSTSVRRSFEYRSRLEGKKLHLEVSNCGDLLKREKFMTRLNYHLADFQRKSNPQYKPHFMRGSDRPEYPLASSGVFGDISGQIVTWIAP
jgi:hypothetical protein